MTYVFTVALQIMLVQCENREPTKGACTSPPNPGVSPKPFLSIPPFVLQAELSHSTSSVLSVLIDFGSAQIPLIELNSPVKLIIDRGPIGTGLIQ